MKVLYLFYDSGEYWETYDEMLGWKSIEGQRFGCGVATEVVE